MMCRAGKRPDAHEPLAKKGDHEVLPNRLRDRRRDQGIDGQSEGEQIDDVLPYQHSSITGSQREQWSEALLGRPIPGHCDFGSLRGMDWMSAGMLRRYY
jgi:hypothetical protein